MHRRSMSVVGVVAVALAACSSGTPGAGSASPTSIPSSAGTSASATTAAAECQAGDQVTVYFVTESQVELRCSGAGVLMDVVQPGRLSTPVRATDVLTVTHGDPDHLDPGFAKTFAGPKLIARAGTLDAPGVHVTSVPSAHNEGDPITATGATDYIDVVDIAGLRIAHFGDVGQRAFTADQLAAIGHVDVAFGQLENPYSEMTVANHKGFDLMAQVKPRVFVITHLFEDEDAARLALKTWEAHVVAGASFVVSTGSLPSKPVVVFMAENADTGRQVGASLSGW